MSFIIEQTDSLRTKRLKLIYLIPLAFITWPLNVIYAGIQQVGGIGEVIREIKEIWKGAG